MCFNSVYRDRGIAEAATVFCVSFMTAAPSVPDQPGRHAKIADRYANELPRVYRTKVILQEFGLFFAVDAFEDVAAT
jgi:hypothetical protein